MFGCSSFPMSLADRSFDSDGNCVCVCVLSTTSIVYEGLRVKTLGSLFLFAGIPLQSNIKMSIQIRPFERTSLAKTISDPKGKKLRYSVFDFGLCCPQPVLFMKA